jgi:predicted ATP-dependent endonuclease of OLD family
LKLTKITILNFKSIQEIEFEIQKYGTSYSTMLLGVNESGKSNILEAMSFLKVPNGSYDYLDYHNQKDEQNQDIDILFSLTASAKSQGVFLDAVLSKVVSGGDLLKFEITDIEKDVYLRPDSTDFRYIYSYSVDKLTTGLFVAVNIAGTITRVGKILTEDTYSLSSTALNDEYVKLDNSLFREYFGEVIEDAILELEPTVTYWTPSNDYLISTENLISFAETPQLKPALKNIFLIAGYDTNESIKAAIGRISNGQHRSRLQSKLQEFLDSYIKNVWKHDIDIVVDLTETGQFTLSIRDSGEKNKHDRLPINGRSEGARHFLSLILSLSIESKHDKLTNQLILIDEPEVHLHPSGIRDLRNELLKIGEKNYLFASTHSPFLVDKLHKERNIIIKKNGDAKTEKKHIQSYSDSLDDEVLYEAFGLDVYKDLLNPHSILVEGASDKTIILKALEIKEKIGFGITNGHGSNIVTLAAKLNESFKSILVILDDDKDGRSYKSKIIKLAGSYSDANVVTLIELVDSLVDGSTIEDLLGKGYVQSTFHNLYMSFYSETECDLELVETEAFVKQMKAYLQKKAKQDIENFMESLKDKLANNFSPIKGSFEKNFPLLDKLTAVIASKLS